MVGPGIAFYLIFVIPYILFMYWLVKQDKKKYMWGVIVVSVIAVFGIVVSQRARRVAVQNYKQHQIDAREAEEKNRLDSLNTEQ